MFKRQIKSFVLGAILFALPVLNGCKATEEPKPITVEIAFSPHAEGATDCTAVIVKLITASEKSIFIQAYNFTSEPIGAALVAARKRGVNISIVLDHVAAYEKGCQDTVCKKAGCAVTYDKKHKISHNKIMVIDGETVIGGSFNYSASAEDHNAENVMIIHNENIAALYIANWNVHLMHSEQNNDKK